MVEDVDDTVKGSCDGLRGDLEIPNGRDRTPYDPQSYVAGADPTKEDDVGAYICSEQMYISPGRKW